MIYGLSIRDPYEAAMPQPRRTRPVSAWQVRAYSGKADEYTEAAASELAASRYIAATSWLFMPPSTADAVCGGRLGVRAADDDHEQVLFLLRGAGTDGLEIETDLRRLLPMKTKAEYEPDDIAPSVATKAVERAHRCEAIARTVVLGMGDSP